MSEILDGQDAAPAGARSSGVWIALALLVALGGVYLLSRNVDAVVTPDRVFFTGPDDYMRAYRARLIVAGDAGLIRYLREMCYPTGAVMHWTSPVDWLLAAAAIAFAPLVDHADAFAAVIVWVPVVLGVVYVLGMMGFIARGFGWAAGVLAGLMVVVSPAFGRVFVLGHVDHHAALELLFLAGVLLWVVPREHGSTALPRLRAAIGSGLAIGLAIWIAPQAMLFWVAIALGATWSVLRADDATRGAWARRRFAWNATVLGVVVIGFLTENLPGVYAVAVDRISLVHVGLVLLGFLLPTAWPRRGVGRYGVFALGALAYGGWLWLVRDGAFRFLDRPEFVRWTQCIMECQPMFTVVDGDWSLMGMHVYLAYLPWALPALLVLFAWTKGVSPALKAMLLILAPMLTVMSILQLRWVDHLNVAVVPVTVLGLMRLVELVGGRMGRQAWPRFGIAAVVLALLVYPSARIVVGAPRAGLSVVEASARRTALVADEIKAHFAEFPPEDPRRRAILCEEGEGPMLLYETGLPVVSTVYHRALDGIVASSRFFAERDPEAARAQLDALGVRYVVVPFHPHQQLMNMEWIAFGELRSYGAPERSIDRFGRLREEPVYKMEEVVETMAYRLAVSPTPGLYGVECIARVREDPNDPERTAGLLYVVHDAGRPVLMPELRSGLSD